MTDDDIQQIAEACTVPVREVLEPVLTLVKQVLARVEVLELERLAQQASPDS